MRVWPGIVFPLGLTLCAALAGWQFTVSVETEQERRNQAAISLAGYARMEAGEIAKRARSLTQNFVTSRREARAEQEKNLRVEIRGVMEAVNRVLGASLERNRGQTASRREVPQFPSGFESVKNYLELSRTTPQSDQAIKALHACAPELGGLLPSGCSLAIIENNALEIFSIGGGAPPENSLSVAMNREFIWSDGNGPGRHWTLLVKLHAPERYPLPEAAEVADYLTRELGRIRLDNAVWRGWLLGANGQPAAVFPVAESVIRENREPPPFTGMPGEWVEIDNRDLVWLDASQRVNENFTPAVAVSIVRPAPPLELVSELWADKRWVCTLGGLALLACGLWIWFFRNIAARRRYSPPAAEANARQPQQRPASRQESAGIQQVASELQRRLVLDNAARTIQDVEGVIVADIGNNGEMHVSTAPSLAAARQAVPPPRPIALPSGSLFRLQARHRGGKGRPGCHVLDKATNPVLRTLAARIRPVINEPSAVRSVPKPRPVGRVTERIPRKSTPPE